MRRATFERYIREALLTIPVRIRRRMDNVVFVVEDHVRPARAGERRIRRGEVLLGLYEGVPLTRRGVGYSAVLPDKITIFRDSIESLGRQGSSSVRAIVHETVLHEVGHHLGMGERHVRAWERRRRSRRPRS